MERHFRPIRQLVEFWIFGIGHEMVTSTGGLTKKRKLHDESLYHSRNFLFHGRRLTTSG